MESSLECFVRQQSVPDWYQPLIACQRALVLGVGAIGCSVARNLCRLGVADVVLLDCDVVAASNLNRQVLFSCADVGRRKVDAAKDALQHHNIATNISAVHCNAVTSWSKVVELARSCEVVFNCIDYGEYFDCAVASLCVSLSLPYVSASSYGHSAIAECYPSLSLPSNGPCWACNNALKLLDVLEKITPDKIAALHSVEFLPQDSGMPTNQDVGSSVVSCTLASTLATGAWVNSLHGYHLPNWMSCDFVSFQMFSYPAEPRPDCIICQHAPHYSAAILDVFFGTSKVKLSAVEGKVVPYLNGTVEQSSNKGCFDRAKERLRPSLLGGDCTRCYLPAVPAADLHLNISEQNCSQLPAVLQTPLLKTKDGSVTAIRSGGRSAVLSVNNKCYRLKGCGNFVDADGMRFPYPGFPLENIKDGVEIRGCCFSHTVLIEQYTSDLIGKLLAKHGVLVGNLPLAMWQYDSIQEDALPEVIKYCGVFETLGEKRLASHLFPGLESLLPLVFQDITMEQVMALFPIERLTVDKDGVSTVTPTWSACCSGSNKISPIDMCTYPLLETVPTMTPDVPPALLQVWCQAKYTLKQTLAENGSLHCGSLMALLYWQLGWEVGVVKRCLKENDINWGYFFDHNPFEPHCNAHPNNFVVLPPGNTCLLAPVDFDFSFQRSGFFSPYTGEPDDELFDSWLESETTELERALAGDHANTGLSMARDTAMPPTAMTKAMSWAFRDTMVVGYRSAYSDEETSDMHAVPNKLKDGVHALITMSLVLTHSFTA